MFVNSTDFLWPISQTHVSTLKISIRLETDLSCASVCVSVFVCVFELYSWNFVCCWQTLI